MSQFLPTRLSGPALQLVMSGTFLIVFGCASGPNGQLTAWRLTDPPQRSPFARPLTAPIPTGQPHDAGRPAQSQATPQDGELNLPTTVRQKPTESSPSEPATEEGFDSHDLMAPSPSDDAFPVPYAEFELADKPVSPLKFAVFAPATAFQGDDVTIQITVGNERSTPVEDVIIVCRLPDGLEFLEFPDRASQNKLGSLNARQERTLDLTLNCTGIGQLCVTFEVTGNGIETVTESVCVECTSPAASSTKPPLPSEPLELIGPSERTIGSRAEFVLTVRNLTGIEQPDVHVTLEHEGVLETREASAGAIRRPGRLEWDLGMLRIDERVQMQVEFECLSLTDETRLTASVTGQTFDVRPVKACLKTTPREEVDLDIVDGEDPVTMGEKVTYVIHVTNAGLEKLSNTSLLLLTEGLQPLGLMVDEKPMTSGVSYDRSTGRITIPLSDDLRPDATRTITLQTLATRAGAASLNAIVSQQGTTLSITTSEPTVINPLGNSVALDK